MTSLCFTALLLFVVGCSVVHTNGSNYVVEIYLVVEPQVIENYKRIGYNKRKALKNLKGDIDFMIYEVNRYFRSMKQYGENIEVRVKKLDILKKQELYPDCKLVHGDKLQADFSLEVFKDWLKKTNAHRRIQYDLAFVYTGFNLIGSGGSPTVVGYATVGAVCKPDHGVGIVEFDMTQGTAITTAHELAHSLGASHDHEGGGHGRKCDGGYIMSAVSLVTNEHRWEFSSCTGAQIKGLLDKLDSTGKNCLLKTTTPRSGFRLSSQKGRDLMDVQKICQRSRKDVESYFCPHANFYNNHYPKGDPVCQYLFCGPKGGDSCRHAMPSEGMACDEGRRCYEGKCLKQPESFPTHKRVRQDCVFGDIHSGDVFGGHKDCEVFLDKEGLPMCKQEVVMQFCCETCERRRLKIKGCPWGDGNVVCRKLKDYQCRGNEEVCCHRCHNVTNSVVGKRAVDDFMSIPAQQHDLTLKEVIPRVKRSAPVTMEAPQEEEDKLTCMA